MVIICWMIGWAWIVVIAFRKSLSWGVLCVVLPFACLGIVIMNWNEPGKNNAKNPFMVAFIPTAAILAVSMIETFRQWAFH